MDYKKSFIAYYIGYFGGLFIILLSCVLNMNWILCGIGLTIIFVAHIQVGMFYKCPHCATYLNIRARKPKHCPECGQKIEWNEESLSDK